MSPLITIIPSSTTPVLVPIAPSVTSNPALVPAPVLIPVVIPSPAIPVIVPSPSVVTKPPTPKPIRLLDYQEPHVAKLRQALISSPVVLDYSKTGLGKTYTTSALASLYGLPMIIITSPTVFKVWEDMHRNHGVVIWDMITYDGLRGRASTGCNHRYLTRTADEQFRPTDYLRQILAKGVILVFDEMSKLKNHGAGVRKAAHAIIKELVASRSCSRALLLSALPCDKTIQLLSLTQMLGIIIDDNFYEYDQSTKIYRLLGARELVNWCMQADANTTRQIIGHRPITNRQTVPLMAVDLYSKIVAPRLSSCMVYETEKVDIKNGYYHLPEDDLRILTIGETLLSEGIKFGGSDLDLDLSNRHINWGKVTRGLEYLGAAKLRTMARLAYAKLTSNSQSKGVICCWFVAHMEWMRDIFQNFGAKILYGRTSAANRRKIIDEFQEPNSKCRVLVINPTVGGIGINLDDRHGDWPRWMLIIPDYRLMEQVQCTGRIDRRSTLSKSETEIRFVYSTSFRRETRILPALLRKSEAARRVIFENSGLVLPDNYDVYNEEGTPELPFYMTPPPVPTLKEE